MSFVNKLKRNVSNFIDYINEDDKSERSNNEKLKKYDDYLFNKQERDRNGSYGYDDLNKSKFSNLINKQNKHKLTRDEYLSQRSRPQKLNSTTSKITKTQKPSHISNQNNYLSTHNSNKKIHDSQKSKNRNSKEKLSSVVARNFTNIIKKIFTTEEEELNAMRNQYVVHDFQDMHRNKRNSETTKHWKTQQMIKSVATSDAFKNLIKNKQYDEMMLKQLKESSKFEKDTKINNKDVEDDILSRKSTSVGVTERNFLNSNLNASSESDIRRLKVKINILKDKVLELKEELKSKDLQLELKETQLQNSERKISRLENIICELNNENDEQENNSKYGIKKEAEDCNANSNRNINTYKNDDIYGLGEDSNNIINSEIQLEKDLVESRRVMRNLPAAQLQVLDPLPLNMSPERKPLFTSSPTRRNPTSINRRQRGQHTDAEHVEKSFVSDSEKITRNLDDDEIDSNEQNVDESDFRSPRKQSRAESHQYTISKERHSHTATSLSPVRIDYSKYCSSSPTQNV